MLSQISAAFSDKRHQPFHWDGGDRVALLVHGFPGTPDEMRPAADLLHGMGWSIRAILLPGFGHEIENVLGYTHDDWLAHVIKTVNDLKQTYNEVMLVGFSMGGALSIHALTEISVDRLVLFSPFTEVNHFVWRALPIFGFIFPRVKIFRVFKPDFTDPQVREGFHKFLPTIDLDDPTMQQEIVNFELPITMFDEIRKIGQKAIASASAIDVPTIVFQGKRDDLVQPEQTKALIAQAQVSVDYVEIDADHEILNDDLPEWSIIVDKLYAFAGYEVAQEG